MDYSFEYCLPIYNEDKELVACLKSIFSLLEARVYHNSTFMGYNLMAYYDGQYVLLTTYDHEDECTEARIRILTAFNENRSQIYL